LLTRAKPKTAKIAASLCFFHPVMFVVSAEEIRCCHYRLGGTSARCNFVWVGSFRFYLWCSIIRRGGNYEKLIRYLYSSNGMCLVRNCVPAEPLVRENSNPNEIYVYEFVLPAKRERRRFDYSSPHQFFGVQAYCANTSFLWTVKSYTFVVH
jgi:hypothetical protein